MQDKRPEANRYASERDLVEHFTRCLGAGLTPWGRVSITFEFDYVGGWADVLALCADGRLVAFEAKLARWRDALHQAYRTRCFAHRSYVVLPYKTAVVAAQFEGEFRRRRVGLCAVSEQRGVELLLDTDVAMPLQPWLALRAVEAVSRPSALPTRGGEVRRCQPT